MKIVSIVGARPQFIKAATLSRAIAARGSSGDFGMREVSIHTGQHFDANMSQIFFEQLAIPEPKYNLNIAGLTHGAMTGRMMEAIEQVLVSEKPDCVLVYGDTNSTLAGTLAAVKLHQPVAHIEAGLRSFNMRMPEEINRIVTDRVSTLLLCPTEGAVRNLAIEGITRGVFNVGDVMYDAALIFKKVAAETYSLRTWNLAPRQYVVCTVHRAENTDDEARFNAIWAALKKIAKEIRVILPVHPRTRSRYEEVLKDSRASGISLLDPLSYLEMAVLELNAKAILTDSGGVQKEAFFYQVPCLTLRDETEWVETVETGWNDICGASEKRILDAWRTLSQPRVRTHASPYGVGNSAELILETLSTWFCAERERV